MTEPINNGDKTDNRQSGGKFAPGNVANPSGRPKGARNKTTLAVEALLEGQHTALTQAAIVKALEGDTTALKLCLDRIAPVRRGRPVLLDLPDLSNARSLAEAGLAVGEALADGELSPEEAAGVLSTLDGIKRLYETTELEQRITALEQNGEGGK